MRAAGELECLYMPAELDLSVQNGQQQVLCTQFNLYPLAIASRLFIMSALNAEKLSSFGILQSSSCIAMPGFSSLALHIIAVVNIAAKTTSLGKVFSVH